LRHDGWDVKRFELKLIIRSGNAITLFFFDQRAFPAKCAVIDLDELVLKIRVELLAILDNTANGFCSRRPSIPVLRFEIGYNSGQEVE